MEPAVFQSVGALGLVLRKVLSVEAAFVYEAEQCGLLILGIQRIGSREKLFGSFTRELAKRTSCPIIVLSRRG
jgi:nucleotide-binding universal stress UspA family protein